MSQSRSARPSRPSPPPWAAGTETRHDELFPTLSDGEIDLVRGYGEERRFDAGTRLWEVGDRDADFFLVLEGELEIFRPRAEGDLIIVRHGPGGYSGEVVTMSGRGAFVAGRATKALRAVVVTQRNLRDLLALEAELGEKILLSFILRRMRMIAEQQGAVVLVGDAAKRDTAAVREFLSRNGVPFDLIHPGDPADAERRARLEVDGADTPLVLCGGQRLVRPSLKAVADCLGLTARIPPGARFDVAVVGAGPAGLAAAVYAASEGLSVVVLERCAVGGQAGASSRIENYLGFPTGISGQALTGRGFLQAQKFGAEVAIAREAVGFEPGRDAHTLLLENGDRVQASAVIIASGAAYRQPPIERLADFDGASVHYGASHIQAMLCRDREVVIIGGGNSAGQAAIYLSGHARAVSILIRGESLAASMSDYLIRRIERTANIRLLTHTEAERVEGEGAMEALIVRDNRSGERTRLAAAQLFIFIGAVPASGFAGESVALDAKGFVKTGDSLGAEDLARAGWPLERRPHLFETSCPRVFAAGDIRSGSVKRVASAVGEGSVCVQFIHTTLGELRARASG